MATPSIQEILSNRIQWVRKKIERSAVKSALSWKKVELLAITKSLPLEIIRIAFDCGLSHFGESRLQEAKEKILNLPQAQWDFIGHLQSRKAKEVIQNFTLIHSVDSLKLVEKLNQEGEEQKRKVSILLQLNISQEKSKYGFMEKEFWELLPKLKELDQVQIRGLMCMAPLSSNPEISRPIFKKAREIFEKLQHSSFPKIDILSMGMSQDFEVAIEEGSNCVRIGHALFEGLV